MTSKAKNGAYKILAAQKSAITKIAGVIMPKAVDNLENKIGEIFTILKSTHFDEGQQYGYLACVIPEEKYRVVISNATWTYVHQSTRACTQPQHLEQASAPHNESRSLQTTRTTRSATPSTSARRKPGRSSSSMSKETTPSRP
jgi:hypothetical protein